MAMIMVISAAATFLLTMTLQPSTGVFTLPVIGVNTYYDFSFSLPYF
jgi:hypothetical protein